ncbi:hypothetical protein [Streptomyces sp. NPDC012746]|uniref:hypothetical protein n=1 Tax=Streptomyces sp. NPDC012746 TaxID=3364845 RepID=UPI00369896B5
MAGFQINKRAIEKMQREIAKEFERANRKHPVRVPIQIDAPDLGALLLSSRSGLESDPHLSRLLLWLHDSAQQYPGRFIDVAAFLEADGMPVDEADNLALQLEKLGLVRIARNLGGRLNEVYPTDDGLLEARRLLRLRADVVARFGHACDVLLHWILRAGGRQAAVSVLTFTEDPLCTFAGDPLAEDEILAALDYLAHHALVLQQSTEAGATAQITAAGTHCVLAGGTVNDYLSRRPTGGDTYNINNSQGFVAGSQQNVVQHNNTGLDVSKLAEFAQLVRQFGPNLGASEEEQSRLIVDAEVLEEVTAADQPEPGRVRAAYDRVHAALTAIGSASPGLVMLVQTGEAAYRAAFGG